jgi:outer membrane lipoprotein-sorting protein
VKTLRLLWPCFLWLTLGAAEPAPRKFLTGKKREALLAKIEKRMSGVRSLAASFRQEKELRIFKSKVRSSGFLLYSRPASLRWEISAPFRSILVVTGSKVGKFEYVDGRRRSLELGRGSDAILIVMDQIRSWFHGKFARAGEYYEVGVSESPTPLVVLRPKIEALKKNLREIKVELKEDLSAVSRVTVVENQGDRTVMQFDELGRNLSLPPAAFSTTKPLELDLEELKEMLEKKSPEEKP